MNVYESIMQGLTEAVAYQQGKLNARKIKLSIKPVDTFNKPEGTSRCLLEIVRDDPGFLQRFQVVVDK